MDVYQIVTDKIVAMLETGVVPWRRPWTSAGLPRNLVTKKPYRGINHFLLSASKYVSPFWLTLKQANELGGSVRKGEQSTVIVFWKVDQKEGETDDAGERGNAAPVSAPVLSRVQSRTMRPAASQARQTAEDRNARPRPDRRGGIDYRQHAAAPGTRNRRLEGFLQLAH